MVAPVWTAAEDAEATRRRLAGEPVRDIALALGRSAGAVWRRLADLGVKPAAVKPRKRWRVVRGGDWGREWTAAELDALVSEQMRCLPPWWAAECEKQRREDGELDELTSAALRELSAVRRRGRGCDAGG